VVLNQTTSTFRNLTLLCLLMLLIVGCGKKESVKTTDTASPNSKGVPDASLGAAELAAANTLPAEEAAIAETTDVAAGQATEAAKLVSFPPLASLPELPVPADNPISDVKIELGKLLFFDDRLSGDVGTSCASCHDSRLGWGDGNALSRGYAGTQHWRNSQTTINTAYLSKLFWAGESPASKLKPTARSRVIWPAMATR